MPRLKKDATAKRGAIEKIINFSHPHFSQSVHHYANHIQLYFGNSGRGGKNGLINIIDHFEK